MTMQAAETPVQASIVVEAPIERAFEVFTEEMASWWNPEHHLLKGKLAEMVFEPRVGGYIYDRAVDGREDRWARVLAYDPPRRLVFSWDISLRWERESDPEKTSDVEVRFEPEGPQRTRVELKHRNLERHGPGWEGMREAVSSEGGWPSGLRRFAEQVSG